IPLEDLAIKDLTRQKRALEIHQFQGKNYLTKLTRRATKRRDSRSTSQKSSYLELWEIDLGRWLNGNLSQTTPMLIYAATADGSLVFTSDDQVTPANLTDRT